MVPHRKLSKNHYSQEVIERYFCVLLIHMSGLLLSHWNTWGHVFLWELTCPGGEAITVTYNKLCLLRLSGDRDD